MIDLDNLRKLEAAATPGPWIHDLDDTHYVRHHHVRHPNGWQTLALTNLNHHDAALIAAMRNALLALLEDDALDAKRNRSEAERALHSITDAFACRPSDVDDAIAAAHLLVAERDAARAEAARLTRELADSEESAGSWREQAQLVAAEVARLRGLVVGTAKLLRDRNIPHTDHACDECVPGGPIVIPGFACVVHAIRKEAAGE